LPSHGAARRSVRLHSAEADPLRARRRFERALADVEWSPPGLLPRALLFVRQRVGISLRQKNLWASFGFGRLPSTWYRESSAIPTKRGWVDFFCLLIGGRFR